MTARDAALNRIAVELRLAFLRDRSPKIAGARFDEVDRLLDGPDADAGDDPAATVELALFRALAEGPLERGAADLAMRFGVAPAAASGGWPPPRLVQSAHFVLDPYLEIASEREAAVARRLLERLGGEQGNDGADAQHDAGLAAAPSNPASAA